MRSGPNILETLQAFDGHAADYGRWERSPTAQSWRTRVIARCVASFPQASRVLDVGGGTGVDGLALTHLGYRVTVAEPSPGMAAIARARGLDVVGVPADGLDPITDTFDGLLSNFGALNCLNARGLHSFGAHAARLVPEGRLVLVVMGPFALREFAYLITAGRPRAWWRRRAASVPLGTSTVPVCWWRPGQLTAALPDFRLRHVEALGAVAPAPDLRVATLRERRWDQRLGSLPGVNRVGDHTLCVFERR